MVLHGCTSLTAHSILREHLIDTRHRTCCSVMQPERHHDHPIWGVASERVGDKVGLGLGNYVIGV